MDYGISSGKDKEMNCLTAGSVVFETMYMRVADTIRDKLTAALSPTALSVEDESAKHAGHSGARPGGQTHFRVRVVSSAFAGLSRVQRQRKVYEALSAEMDNPIHALALTTLTPDEAQP